MENDWAGLYLTVFGPGFPVPLSASLFPLQNSQKIDQLDGAHAPELAKKVERHAASGSFPLGVDESPKEALNARLKKLTHAAPCMLFMKGTPQEPRCGKELVQASGVQTLWGSRCP